MSWGIVDRKAVPDFGGHLSAEDVAERLAVMDVQVIHYQVDGLGLGELQGQGHGDLGELEAGSIRRGEGERRPAFGSTAQKTLAVPRRSYSLSRLASRPGTAGEVGRISACRVTGFSSRQTTGLSGGRPIATVWAKTILHKNGFCQFFRRSET